MISRIFSLLIIIIRVKYSAAQCNGSPLFILPNNNTGNLAFPESNLDLMTGAWTTDHLYPVSVSCTWILKAPPLHVIYLKILYFDTEEEFDYVTLFSSESRKEELFKFSGTLKEFWDVFTPDNTLVIDFISDEYTNYNGFHFAFMYLPKACVTGGVTIAEQQLIALPPWNLQGVLPGPKRPGFEASSMGIGIPLMEEIYTPTPRWVNMSPYPQGLNCTWHIKVPQKHLLQVDVLQFQTDVNDVLQIWKISGKDVRPLLKYWGTEVPRPQIKSSDPLLLNFASVMSDRSMNSGFLLNVSYVSRGCNPSTQELMLPSGYIGYPQHNFRNNEWQFENAIFYGFDSCEWIIKAPEGYSLNVTILHLDTRLQDFLKITENNMELLSHGGQLPEKQNFVSKSNQLSIKFASNFETEKTGFLIHYAWFLRECNFELKESEAEVRSPFYPDVYGGPLECSWTIKPPSGSVVHVLIARIRLDQGDYLQVSDGNQNVLYSQASSKSELLELHPTDLVKINFLSDALQNNGFFLLKYDVFESGSCNFSISTCGWKPADHLQVWNFKEKEGMSLVEKNSKIGFQLPRGFRTQIISPIIYPQSQNMCFKLHYLLLGEDAYKMSVSLTERRDLDLGLSGSALRGLNEHRDKMNLIQLHGSQGDIYLNAAVNFTSFSPFQLTITYERGYGPHYKVGINEINLSSKPCGFDLEELSSFSCSFKSTFCGWKNTHKDHRNWQVGLNGVSSLSDENISISWVKKNTNVQNQFSDLVSPVINSDDFRRSDQNQSNICLSLSYQIHSPLAELRIIFQESGHEGKDFRYFDEENKREEEIWGQGRVLSPKILFANIPLTLDSLPARFRIILRAVSFRNGLSSNGLSNGLKGFGVSVFKVHLESEFCSEFLDCDFENGFCSWRIVFTGNSVWYIKEIKNNTFAAFSSNGHPADSSQMISPSIDARIPKTLSFRYLIKDTNQCIKIATMKLNPGNDQSESSNPLIVIWEQCRGKGDHWLNECIDLPVFDGIYKIIIGSGTGFENSKIWLDDLQIRSGSCSPSSNVELSYKISSWECRPELSFCGMTQPLPGSWDWAYYYVPNIKEFSQLYRIENDASEYAFSSASKFQLEDTYSNNEYEETLPNNNQRSNLIPQEGMFDLRSNSFPSESVFDLRSNLLPPEPESVLDSSIYDNNIHEFQKTSFYLEKNQLRDEGKLICSDGRILDPSFVCDGVPDCDDERDEIHCDCGPDGCGHNDEPEFNHGFESCPGETFMCPSGRLCPEGGCSDGDTQCLPKMFHCDGQVHCNKGEDEHACEKGWMSDEPKKKSKRQARGYGKFLNAPQSIEVGTFECSQGLILPQSFRCDGIKDCPLDGLDEIGCLHCGPDDFLCPESGICLPRSIVCDGELSIQTCTDEVACGQCAPGQFACDVCIPSMKVCDGVWDCSKGEDEIRCLDLSPTNFNKDSKYTSIIDKKIMSTGNKNEAKCPTYQFTCSNDRCLPATSVCDRQTDCVRGEDEHNCLDDNREEEFYISAKASSHQGIDPWTQFPSYLITPILHQPPKSMGLLSFRYRLDSWVGSTNVTLSVELLNAHDTRISLAPWSLWRQAGHKGKLWLNTYVIIPELPDITDYRIGFLLSGVGLSHLSEQIHLSKISFKAVEEENIKTLAENWSTCEFSENWCGWSQSYTEEGYSWVHATASPHARRTGPITGYGGDISSGFIYTDSLLGEKSESADLLSPAIQLQNLDQTLCFSFAMFLYGSHVDKLSLHIMQVTPSGHPFTRELFHSYGGRGLSWIPVSVTIDKTYLKEPLEPFIIVFRAIRGNGPEADIALDHISFKEGNCDSETKINVNFLLQPLISPSASYIRSLKSGLSLTPYIPTTHLEKDSSYVGNDSIESESNTTSKTDLCSLYDSCYNCVISIMSECSWCSKTHFCSSTLSSAIRSCPRHLTIHNNSTGESQTGPMWCPRFAPGQAKEILAPAGSPLALSFAVTNIQAAHTTSNWICVFTLEKQIENNLGNVFQNDHSRLNDLSGNDININKNAGDNSENEDEELWRKLKKYAMDKKYGKKVIKIPGVFQGTVYRSSNNDAGAAEVGVGAIKCEDSETLLEIPGGKKVARINVELHTPDLGVLDNPEDVHVTIFRCKEMASDCKSCVSMNTSFPCGWCAFTDTCTSHGECVSGLWHSHTSTPNRVCSVQEELDFIKNLLEGGESDEELTQFGESDLLSEKLDFLNPKKRNFSNKRKIKSSMKKALGEERKEKNSEGELKEEEENEIEQDETKENENNKEKNKIGNKNKKSKSDNKEKNGSGKGSIKLGKKNKGKGFVRVPIQNGVFIARDVWKLHTGKQYYVPVMKKTLINLGFVRHVTYGRLSEEKSRTLLMDGAWKKAAGYYMDLYEKAGQDPMTSIITTNKDTFEKILGQILPE